MSSTQSGMSPHGAPRKRGLVAVAEALGVSPSTVSNAYNRPDQLSPALRERVLRTAAELGYAGPDPVARSLRRGRAGAVGVLFHDRLAHAFEDPAAVLLLQGLTEATDAHGLAVVLVPGSSEGDATGGAVRDAAVDGLVLNGLVDDDPVIAATAGRRLPTVVVDTPVLEGVDFVGIDDAAAAEAALGHLLELGHRRIGLLSFRLGPGAAGPFDAAMLAAAADGVAKRRLEGCGRALAAAGLGWADVRVEQCAVSSAAAGRAGACALLAREPELTALFAFSDPLALGAKRAAAERGLSVPGDVSLVGFDGTAPAAEGLTSVEQPQRVKGRRAAERLVRALGPNPPAPHHEFLPTRLVVRASTAPAPRAAAA